MNLISVDEMKRPHLILKNQTPAKLAAGDLHQTGFLLTKFANRFVLYYVYQSTHQPEDILYHPDFSFSIKHDKSPSFDSVQLAANFAYEIGEQGNSRSVSPIYKFSHLDEQSQLLLKLSLVLDSVEDVLKWETNQSDFLNSFVENQERFSDYFDYLLIDKQFISPDDIGGSVSLEMFVNAEETVEEHINLDDYISKYIEYRVIHEINGRFEDFFFPFTSKGLLEAVNKYTGLIKRFSFNKKIS